MFTCINLITAITGTTLTPLHMWNPGARQIFLKAPYLIKVGISLHPLCFLLSLLSDGLHNQTVAHCAELPSGPREGSSHVEIQLKQRSTPEILSGPLGFVLALNEKIGIGAGA